MILIKHKGELLLVESASGYPGHRVIARDVDPPPHDHCHWKGGKWVEDSEAKSAADEHALLASMSRADFLKHVAQTANLPPPSPVVKPSRRKEK